MAAKNKVPIACARGMQLAPRAPIRNRTLFTFSPLTGAAPQLDNPRRSE